MRYGEAPRRPWLHCQNLLRSRRQQTWKPRSFELSYFFVLHRTKLLIINQGETLFIVLQPDGTLVLHPKRMYASSYVFPVLPRL